MYCAEIMVRHWKPLFEHFWVCSDILLGHLKITISDTELLSSIFFTTTLCAYI